MLLKNIINFIIDDHNNICSLCLKNMENTDNCVHLNDHIMIDNQKTTTFFEIVNTILDVNVLDNAYITNICQGCAKMAINSYIFKKMCQKNHNSLVNTVFYLLKAMETTITTSNYKSLFMFKNKFQESYGAYFCYDTSSSVTDAVKLIQSLYEQIIANKDCSGKNQHHGEKKKLTTEHIPESYAASVLDYKMEESTTSNFKNEIVPLGQFYRYNKHADTEIEKNKTSKSSFGCKMCLKTFATSSSLTQHIKRIHAPKLFKCTKCPRQYGSASILETHMHESHTGSVCTTCRKMFSKQSLKFHMLSHKTQLICPNCGRIYKHKNTFNHHISKKICEQTARKTVSQAVLTCDLCKKKILSKIIFESSHNI